MAGRESWRPHLGLVRAASVVLVLSVVAPGLLASKVVTFDSILIYTTHEWLPFKPNIYFHCQGENKTFLPDVKETNVLYSFKGQESWQPLTVLNEKKCKRCGLYEQDNFKNDDVFDEWELCPDDFVQGLYRHFKKNEFNATLRCTVDASSNDGSDQPSSTKDTSSHKHVHIILVVIICTLVSVAVIAAFVVAYRYWQKWKREKDQARFLKIFDENDEAEDEIQLSNAV